MCSGDLGMYRVMPWAYPPISGGSSGGFSPDDSNPSGASYTLKMGEDSTIRLGINNITSVKNRLGMQIELTKFEIGSVRGINAIYFAIDIEDLELNANGDVTDVISNIVSNSSITIPFDQIVNSTFTMSVQVNFATSMTSADPAVKYMSSTIRAESKDFDGNTVRTDVFPFVYGVKK